MIEAYLTFADIICPLGDNLPKVFENVRNKKTGIRKDKRSVYSASFTEDEQQQLFGFHFSNQQPAASTMLLTLLDRFLKEKSMDLKDPKTLLIICSTKGDIEELPEYSSTPLLSLSKKVINVFAPANIPFIISNACISGLHGLIHGQRLIINSLYDKVLVVGVDSASNFVRQGFTSLATVSDEPCRPFDAKRNGLSLGEAVVIALLENKPTGPSAINLVHGCLTNDANHITGPSRDGSGLYKAIKGILDHSNPLLDEYNAFISPHGTATVYNDEMESLAFSNANLSQLPMVAYKGYFGHTLGTSGLLETIIGLETLRTGIIPVSYGYEEHGVSKKLNILKQSDQVNVANDYKYFIKTGSGFGGCNAALLFCK